jgi:CDP-diacylglycerol--glycerol-3-phosphate 3-phosphatidyltransferase
MDSVFDRWGEAVVYLGIAWGAVLADSDTVAILATAALGAAFMVSYTRAKSEGLGFSPGIGMAAIGVMPREIRLIVLSLGLIIAGATANLTILAAALAIIAIGAVITVIQRILQTRSQAESADTHPTQ